MFPFKTVSTAATRTSGTPVVTPSSASNPETLHTEKTKRTTVLFHTENRKRRQQSQEKGITPELRCSLAQLKQKQQQTSLETL